MTETDHTPGGTRATEEHRLSDGEATVTVRKLVSQGERLEIETTDHGVKLDALLLEGLSWQRDPAAIDAVLGEDAVASDEAAEAANDTVPAEDSPDAGFTISSEYSHVEVQPVSTPAGDTLAVTTPGRGSTIVLGVQSLQAIAAVEDTYAFSVWFRTPFGPEDTPVEGPL